MGSNLSDTQICNMALDLLEEAPIDSIDDNLSVARWFKRNFWPTAWALMRKHPWNFAIDRRLLAASSTAPAFGWSTAYDIPAEWLRVLPLTIDGTENGRQIPHKVEQGRILTNATISMLGLAGLPVRGIKRIDNTGLFDNQFADALAASLGMKAAHFITGKQSYAERMGNVFQGALADAQIIDSLEGTPDDPIDDFWISARQ